MLARLFALVIKELLAVLRDRRGWMVLIGPPIAQLLVFAVAATQVYSSDIEAGCPTGIQLILDGRRSNAAQIAQGYAAGIVQGLNDTIGLLIGLSVPALSVARDMRA